MRKSYRDGWIKTISDTDFCLSNPRPEMIKLSDIIHALALTNRYVGHSVRPYSVAEHLCRCNDIATETFCEDVQLEVLIHDFAEAYYGDVSSPLKQLLGRGYKQLEETCQEVINEKFLGYKHFKYEALVKLIDNKMRMTEMRDITNQTHWWEAKDEYEYLIPRNVEYSWTFWKDVLTSSLALRGIT